LRAVHQRIDLIGGQVAQVFVLFGALLLGVAQCSASLVGQNLQVLLRRAACGRIGVSLVAGRSLRRIHCFSPIIGMSTGHKAQLAEHRFTATLKRMTSTTSQ
jgi:hypothetical protein